MQDAGEAQEDAWGRAGRAELSLRQVRCWQAPPGASPPTCGVCAAALCSGSFCQGRSCKEGAGSTRQPTGILGFHLFILLLPSPGKREKSTEKSFPAWMLIMKKCCPALSLVHVPAVMVMCCSAKLEQTTWLSVESVSIKINGVNKPGRGECTVS